jgi:predicted phage terminase large subunit-like protein
VASPAQSYEQDEFQPWHPIWCSHPIGGEACQKPANDACHSDDHEYVSSPQERFLRCGAFEALYGGAAGGGKTDALLGGAARFVDHRDYRALILRREWPEARRTLLDRGDEIYSTLGGEWSATEKLWRFPSGATIEIGSCEHERDITKYQGAPYQNVSFDELTHFTEKQYTYMLSRLRSKKDAIPLRLRASTNPGGIGHDWVLRRFAPWLYPPDSEEWEGERAEPGERLWFKRQGGGDVIVPPGTPGALSRAFFPALVTDNPFYAGTAYEDLLDALDPLTREQLKKGNWMARPAAGAFFKRVWCKRLDVCPMDVIGRVRYWDRAASEDPKAAFSVGVRMAKTRSGLYVVEDVVRGQWSPGLVAKTILQTARRDPKGTSVVLELDPGQAGIFEWKSYARILDGFDARSAPPLGDKVTRFKPFSAQAEAGNVLYVKGRWNEVWLGELESFPEGFKDQADATGGAYRQLLLRSRGNVRVGGQRRQMPQSTGGW